MGKVLEAWYGNVGRIARGMLKKAVVSPAQPRRAETRLSMDEAAASEAAKHTGYPLLHRRVQWVKRMLSR